MPRGRAYRYIVKALRERGRDVHADAGGQSLIELALALPILVFLLMGGADFARVYSAQVGVLNAARVGAESAASRAPGVTIPVVDNDAAVIAYARNELARAAGVDGATATITHTNTVGAGGELLTTVRVRYTHQTVVPWPLLPNNGTVPLDRTVVFRRYP